MTTAHPLCPENAAKEPFSIMGSDLAFSFPGYHELIKKPLESTDPKSLTLINGLLRHSPDANTSAAYSYLIKMLSGISIAPREAQQHWKKICEHKRHLELKLCRVVHIRTAIVDYYDLAGITVDPEPRMESGGSPGPSAARAPVPPYPAHQSPVHGPGHAWPAAAAASSVPIPPPGYHQERLKEELLRARRYKHSLSALMLDADLSVIEDAEKPEQLREKVLAGIDQMINKAIRNVDIKARHANSHFFLILPNTNKREAQELATRLHKNIFTRLHRIPGMPADVPVAIAVGQCCLKNDTSGDFIKRLENLLKSSKNASVLLLE
ncbi:MAG: diguanylate cyclase [Chitinispirillaceae bacterium]|nr:diguanylate cyclase [Chitinispirillaceae bacterium]